MSYRIALALMLVACSRDVEICDAAVAAAKVKEAAIVCEARGYDWTLCPDRQRILRELREGLEACSP